MKSSTTTSRRVESRSVRVAAELGSRRRFSLERLPPGGTAAEYAKRRHRNLQTAICAIDRDNAVPAAASRNGGMRLRRYSPARVKSPP